MKKGQDSMTDSHIIQPFIQSSSGSQSKPSYMRDGKTKRHDSWQLTENILQSYWATLDWEAHNIL